MLLSQKKLQNQNGKNLPIIIKSRFEMFNFNIYLNFFHLLFLSFKNKTTFKFIVSAVAFGKNTLNYLLIKLFIKLIILKFNNNNRKIINFYLFRKNYWLRKYLSSYSIFFVARLIKFLYQKTILNHS